MMRTATVSLATLTFSAAIALWLRYTGPAPVSPRLPGQEQRLDLPARPAVATMTNPGTLVPGEGEPSTTLLGTWPQFRGADRTNTVRDAPSAQSPRRLARVWSEGEPRILWSVEVGEGYAGAAIANGCVYLLDYDREKEEDALRCLSLDDGREVWRYTYSVRIKRNHGMSRTVPAVTDRFVVSLGPMGHVHCLDARTGELIWRYDLVGEFGVEIPPWYAGQCPLIDGDRVILAPGADPLMMAVDLATGRIAWRTPNPGGWGMTHSSIMPMDLGGERQYLYCTTRGVVGVSAADGRVLWTYPGWTIKLATVASPLPIGDGRIFLSGGYNSGAAMIRLRPVAGGAWSVEEVFRLRATVFGSEQHTPILHEGHIYGMIPSREFACLDLEGNRLWTSGPARRFGSRGLGPYLLADGLLFVLTDEGALHLLDASPDRYNELGSAQPLHGHEAWGPMAMASGRLVLRDLTSLVCLEVPVAER